MPRPATDGAGPVATASIAVQAPGPQIPVVESLATIETKPVVLFDGVCNLCNFAVQFILDRDPAATFRFASLQSAPAAGLLGAFGIPAPVGDPESLVLIDDGKVYQSSTAALRIARRLRGAWKLAYALIVIPTPVRDAVYRWIARNRYRWFGKAEQCRVPTPALRARFLT